MPIFNTVYGGTGGPTPRPTITGFTYDNKSFSHSSQEQEAQGMCWKPDGTKFYLVGEGSKKGYQYSCSTPRDISTASYDNKNFSFSSQDSTPNDFWIDDTGTKLYLSGFSNKRVFRYTLGTAWDISTASYDNVSSFQFSAQPQSIYFGNNGNYLYMQSGRSLYRYILSSPRDITTQTTSQNISMTSLGTNNNGLKINPQGTQMFINGRNDHKIWILDLSTARDITSTITYTGISPSYYGDYMILSIGDNGNKLYYGARTGSGSPAASARTIYQYSTVS